MNNVKRYISIVAICFVCLTCFISAAQESNEQLPVLKPVTVIDIPDEQRPEVVKKPLETTTVIDGVDDLDRNSQPSSSNQQGLDRQNQPATVEVVDIPDNQKPPLQELPQLKPPEVLEIPDNQKPPLQEITPLKESTVADLSDEQVSEAQWFFNGSWQPDLDPAEIGAQNYSVLRNLRYKSGKVGLEAVNGYTQINSTPLSTYTKIRSGFHLRTPEGEQSYVLVQAENDGETSSRVYLNTTAIPSTGDFEGTYELSQNGTTYWADSVCGIDPLDGIGMFSEAPLQSVVYCNGCDRCAVFSGEEAQIGAFLTMETGSPHSTSEPIDKTNAAINTLSTGDDYIDIGDDISRSYFLILTTRRAQGFKFYIKTANTETTELTGYYWNGSSLTEVANPVDGTSSGGKALAQTGTFTFDWTSGAAPYHFLDYYMYAYLFWLNDGEGSPASLGDAEIYHVTADLPMQTVEDLWDGIPRQPVIFQTYRAALTTVSKFTDYTLEVNTSSFPTAPIVAQLDALAVDDYIIMASEERLSGAYFEMMSGWLNTGTASFTVYYWNGTDYAAVPYKYDDSCTYPACTGTLQRNGFIWWTPPDESLEHPKLEFGISAYFYKLKVTTSPLSGSYTAADDIMTDAGDIAVDRITLATANKTVYPAKFPVQFNDRLFLCNFEGAHNRCNYASKNTTEAWNGEDSSNDNVYSLYFGGPNGLTGAHEIYNRYGNDVKTLLTVFKQNEVYTLQGDDPESYKINRVSSNIGCPAPLTIASAEIAYEVAPDINRNLLFWLSGSGPYAFDGQFLTPILGIQKYFDPDDPQYINTSYIAKSRGWYDAQFREYNLLIPIGTSTINNKWLVFNVVERKWFEKHTGTAEFPQVGFPVVDTDGIKYTYGGIDTGYLMQLENGPSWNDPAGDRPIEQTVETGDFYPTGKIQDYTRIREVWVMAKRIAEDHVITVFHAPDTNDSLSSGIWINNTGKWEDWSGGVWAGSNLTSIELSMDAGIQRIVRDLSKENLYGWAHRFRFVVKTIDTVKGLQPVVWGIRYYREPTHDQ